MNVSKDERIEDSEPRIRDKGWHNERLEVLDSWSYEICQTDGNLQEDSEDCKSEAFMNDLRYV